MYEVRMLDFISLLPFYREVWHTNGTYLRVLLVYFCVIKTEASFKN